MIFLLLSGRTLGPALPPVRAGASDRSLYEQVQAVAALYRRSHKFTFMRARFHDYFLQRTARSLGMRLDAPRTTPLAAEIEQRVTNLEALASQIAAARGERSLIRALDRAEAELDSLPHSRNLP
jgi:hypothetical protein